MSDTDQAGTFTVHGADGRSVTNDRRWYKWCVRDDGSLAVRNGTVHVGIYSPSGWTRVEDGDTVVRNPRIDRPEPGTAADMAHRLRSIVWDGPPECGCCGQPNRAAVDELLLDAADLLDAEAPGG